MVMKMKKITSLLLICVFVLSLAITACTDSTTDGGAKDEYIDPTANLPVLASEDKYRNFYHIWVCAFNDSNGDETGDINGIIEKLDYLNDGNPETDTDLGVDGIWLSPIMPSTSYHKYDVDDYMDIDPEFGTLEDFDRLIEECDKRGIAVILDLVLNHCGTDHEFWNKAVEEVIDGNLDGYARYYNFTDGTPGVQGWHKIMAADGVWFEGQFSGEMPEWNLNFEGTREYFEEVSKFWLERGVAGFRLDAVKYMTDALTDGNEFLNWFYTTSQKYNPDVYMVGENWQDDAFICDTYESGIDSQFAFSFATGQGHYILSVNTAKGASLASKLKKYDDKTHEANENVINAMFLSNHDQVRSGGALYGGLPYQKMAAAVYLLSPGNSFTYYGEEIGMETPEGYSGNDAYFRGPMIWDSTKEPDIWCVADAFSDCELGGVEQQLQDENSLLSFYRRVIKIKNQNPEIARGRIVENYPFEDKAICAYKVEYQGKELLIVHNLGCDGTATVTIGEDIMESPVIRGDLVASDTEEKVSLSGTELKLPVQSTAVIASGN